MQEVEEELEELGVLGEGRGHSRSEGQDGQTESGCFMFTQIYTNSNIGIIVCMVCCKWISVQWTQYS